MRCLCVVQCILCLAARLDCLLPCFCLSAFCPRLCSFPLPDDSTRTTDSPLSTTHIRTSPPPTRSGLALLWSAVVLPGCILPVSATQRTATHRHIIHGTARCSLSRVQRAQPSSIARHRSSRYCKLGAAYQPWLPDPTVQTM
jgi:hypothetical protein